MIKNDNDEQTCWAEMFDRNQNTNFVKSVLKRRVQFRLIASLTARTHGKVRSLSKSSWLVQPITEQSYQLPIELILFDMGGGGRSMMAPKMFLTTVLKRLGGRS